MSGKKARVYVVDDQEVSARTIAAILNNKGFDATAFSDPMLARDTCERDASDILLSDVVMPVLNGVSLAKFD